MTAPGVKLEYVIQFLDSILGIPGFPDYEGACNGLQVEAPGPVQRIGAAVDASSATIEAAVERGLDLLLVHHGIFWDPSRPLTGRLYRRVAPLLASRTALYSAHLPLDAHPELGNCIQLIEALDLEGQERFGSYLDRDIGFVAYTSEDRDQFRERVAKTVDGPVRLIPGGPREVRRVGVVTGGGSSFIKEAAGAGLDTLLTGEGPHHTYADAMEFGVNVFYAGHYATETWGVRALAARLEEEFSVPWEFLDFPTGL